MGKGLANPIVYMTGKEEGKGKVKERKKEKQKEWKKERKKERRKEGEKDYPVTPLKGNHDPKDYAKPLSLEENPLEHRCG